MGNSTCYEIVVCPLSLSIFLPKLKIEIAVSDENAERAIEAIIRAAQTGKLGDDKIFVFDLEQAVRIRTGETGPEAL